MPVKRAPKQGQVVWLPFIADYNPPIPDGAVRLRPASGSKWSINSVVYPGEIPEQPHVHLIPPDARHTATLCAYCGFPVKEVAP